MKSNKKLTILCSARMGHGTFNAKFNPLVQLDTVEKIIILRKDKGPEIDKIDYKILPKICKKAIFNVILTPFILLYQCLKHNPDIILAYHFQPHFYFAFFVAKLTNKPFIIAQTGTDIQNVGDKRLGGLLLRHITRKASAFNVPGKDTYNYWVNKGVSNNRLSLLHSTIDTNLFYPKNSSKKYDFIFVGRLTEVKRIDKIIEAVSKLKVDFPKVKVCIVGSGHLDGELKAIADKLNVMDNLDFVGLQSNINEWLEKSSAFLMSSDSEGLPCAMMEAMSSGLICIGPDVNNMKDLLIEGETGYLFNTKDVNELKSKMDYVLRNLGNLQQIRSNARTLIINEHSYIVAKNLWTKVLNKII